MAEANDWAKKGVMLFTRNPKNREFFNYKKGSDLDPQIHAIAIQAIKNPELVDLAYRLLEMESENEDEQKIEELVFLVSPDKGKK
jgi:hypothetical protein